MSVIIFLFLFNGDIPFKCITRTITIYYYNERSCRLQAHRIKILAAVCNDSRVLKKPKWQFDWRELAIWNVLNEPMKSGV